MKKSRPDLVSEKNFEPEVIVRRASLEDRPAIFEFIREAYQGRSQYKIPERWEWQFVNNPFAQASDLPIWIAVTKAGRVVGQTCAQIEPLAVGGVDIMSGWSVDTYVLPQSGGLAWALNCKDLMTSPTTCL